ncbi:MAG: MerR family transcriptional regulator [Desulfobulbaceae bacterium]|nr:MerR family transcriptional regulator [Desulfobulbaceae bacterium]
MLKEEPPAQKVSARRCCQKPTPNSEPRYNLSEAAKEFGVHRQTLYYWIKKGWIVPRRDCRGYPVYTLLDIQAIRRWRSSIRH